MKLRYSDAKYIALQGFTLFILNHFEVHILWQYCIPLYIYIKVYILLLLPFSIHCVFVCLFVF